MKEEFVGEPIEVEYDKEEIRPISFTWREKEYKIAEVVNAYQDFGFSGVAPKKKSWRLRKHRNYYIVKTCDGGEFKLYLDRAGGRREWVIFSKYV